MASVHNVAMSAAHAMQRTRATIGAAMLRAIPGRRRLDDSKLKHGCAIFRGAAQLASGYVSDNAPYHAIEFALNQNLLAELPFERTALIRWLEHQKLRFGGRESSTHQRGDPVDWFRIGFGSVPDALTFLDEFYGQRNQANAFSRWAISGKAIDVAAPSGGPVQAEVAWGEVAASQEEPGADQKAARTDSEPVDGSGDEAVDEGIDEQVGNLSNEQYALSCIPVLVDHVLRQTDEVMQKLTYNELARRLHRLNKHGLPAAKGLGVVLGRAMEHIDRAAAPGAAAPYLTTIVVAKNGPDKGLPGVGVRERWHGYDLLTRAEKADRIEAEYTRILQFGSQWNDVLRALGLSPFPDGETLPLGEAVGGWGGGESSEHKALKDYVRTHPELFGAGEEGLEWRASEEYALRSGDEIDVFFKSDSAWIGVEVKSAVSEGNLKDYERGLYQVVKYRAVLLAQAKIDNPDELPTVKVVLALDRALPAQLRAVAEALGVQVVENLYLAERIAACTA